MHHLFFGADKFQNAFNFGKLPKSIFDKKNVEKHKHHGQFKNKAKW